MIFKINHNYHYYKSIPSNYGSFGSRVNLLSHPIYELFLWSWNILNEEEKSPWTARKSKSGPKKTTKAEFFEENLWETVTRHQMYLYPCHTCTYFWWFYPNCHKQWRPLYKYTLKFNNDDVTVYMLLWAWNSPENHFTRCDYMITLAGSISC